MKVYLYDTEQDAWSADATVCQTIGIGLNPDNVTKHYAEPFEYEDKWAYICDEITQSILGDNYTEI
jgi:hypothetical protein